MEDELLTQLQELLATPQLEVRLRGGGVAGEDGIQLYQEHYVLIARADVEAIIARLSNLDAVVHPQEKAGIYSPGGRID